MKVISVIGARPQFVKAAVVSRALMMQQGTEEVLVHTGQHYDDRMSKVFFTELEIPEPAYNLGVGSATHGAQTGRMLEGIEQILLREEPDWTLVYGDTNSTLAGALASAKLHIPVAHVEAGLRSFNRHMPEEINRVLTDHVADLLLAPTATAAQILKREGVDERKTFLVGDVMHDAARFFGAKAQRESEILEQLSLQPRSYVLATIHRAENTSDPARLQSIIEALCQVARRIPVVLPLHPRTRVIVGKSALLAKLLKPLLVTEPVGYLDMLQLEESARLIATDSGGVQKEAFFFSVPCVTLRTETEWVELVENGWNWTLDRFDPTAICDLILRHLDAQGLPVALYGDGNAAEHIAALLQSERRESTLSWTPNVNA